MGWEWDSLDSGLGRKNQGFLLPSWLFYGKQVCSIYVDQQTLAFSRSFEFVSCCLWNSEEFSYLFLQDFGDFKWLRELPHCLNVLSDKKSGFWRFWISKESFEDTVFLEGILLNLSRKFNHLFLVRLLFAEVLLISQESMYLTPGRSDLFCSDISCTGTGFEGSPLFPPVVALSAKFWLGHLLCLI
jgi:hypothetical protein